MAKKVVKISVRAYAATLGIDDKTIRKAIASGKIKKGVSYVTQIRKGVEVRVPEINAVVADLEYGHLHKIDKIKPGQKIGKLIKKVDQGLVGKNIIEKSAPMGTETDTSDDEDQLSTIPIGKSLSYGEAARRRELIGLALDKKKLQELEGVLVRKDVVEKTLFAFGSELKKSLLNIPSRISADIMASTSVVEIQTIITVELTNILNEFSKMQQLKLN